MEYLISRLEHETQVLFIRALMFVLVLLFLSSKDQTCKRGTCKHAELDNVQSTAPLFRHPIPYPIVVTVEELELMAVSIQTRVTVSQALYINKASTFTH